MIHIPKINKDMFIVGFAGAAGSGKDTAFSFLVDGYPNRFVRVAFADKLKDMAAELFGIDRGTLDTLEGKASVINKKWFGDLTNREFLQRMGTDCVRENIDKDFRKVVCSLVN